jgi:hypothetical protein
VGKPSRQEPIVSPSETLACPRLTSVVDLTEPVDIFADWIDSATLLSKNVRAPVGPVVTSGGAGPSRAPRAAAMGEGDEQEAQPRRRFVQEDSDDE